MKLARYWARGEGEAVDPKGNRVRYAARGWSDESVDAARDRAREIAQRVAARIVADPTKRNQYEYGDRPLPEPVIQKIGDSIVTRNGYGALVLNTDNLMFVDVDREEPAPLSAAGLESIISSVFSLFSKPTPPVPKADPVMDSIGSVVERHSLSGRVYKTAGGYRVLITSKSFEAGTSDTEALLQEFGADPLYMRLCRMQESFRARLTPKPWRCDFRNPPGTFPFETPQAEAQFRAWEAEYKSKSAPYATCRFLSAAGSGRVAPEFESLIRYHDQETKATSGLPLA